MPQWDRQESSYVAIGRRLSRLRHALELTQRQIADFLKISGPRWANYEMGHGPHTSGCGSQARGTVGCVAGLGLLRQWKRNAETAPPENRPSRR